MSNSDENINGDLISKVRANKAQHTASPSSFAPESFDMEQRRSFHHADENDIWSSPWASLMMVLFAILFVMISLRETGDTATQSSIQQTVSMTQNNSLPNNMTEEQDIDEAMLVLMPSMLTEIKQTIDTIETDKITASLLIDYSIKISLAASILFDSDSTELTQPARQFLDKLSITLKKNKQQLHVIGHTDDQAIDLEFYTDKWELSLMRASTVTRYLITQGQVEPYKFTIMGRSEYEPLTANLDDNARATNRRVDIIIASNQSRPVENGL